MLEENTRIKNSIPAAYEPLLANRIQILEQSIMPGCINITWVSPILQLNDYYDSVFKNIENFDLLLSRANDLSKYRIEAMFDEIANTKVIFKCFIIEPFKLQSLIKSIFFLFNHN